MNTPQIDVQITSTNIELSESMKEIAQDKLQKVLAKIVHIKDDLKKFRVVLDTAPIEMFKCKIDATLNGKEFFAESIDYNFETSVVKTVEELTRQIEKWKADDEKSWNDKREMKRFSGLDETAADATAKTDN